MFVANSLGGIVVKDVCPFCQRRSAESLDVEKRVQAMHRSRVCRSQTKFVIFLGTPHRGSSFAEWGAIASNIASFALQGSNKRIVKTLDVNSEVLDNIQDEFQRLVLESSIMIHSFQEARGISGVRGVHGKVILYFCSSFSTV